MQMFQTLRRTMGPNDTLNVKCACGHEGSFSRAETIALCGGDARPAEVRDKLRPRLKCGGCDQVGLAEIWI